MSIVTSTHITVDSYPLLSLNLMIVSEILSQLSLLLNDLLPNFEEFEIIRLKFTNIFQFIHKIVMVCVCPHANEMQQLMIDNCLKIMHILSNIEHKIITSINGTNQLLLLYDTKRHTDSWTPHSSASIDLFVCLIKQYRNLRK